MFGQRFSQWLLGVFGWKVEGYPDPKPPKLIIAVVPHTSNWDFPIGLLTRKAIGVDIKFLGKHTLFVPPLGWLFRWLGGYPVDRRKSHNLVDAVVDIFDQHDHFVLSIAPEGTRKRVEQLKTGFYYIAVKATIPILLCSFNFPAKTVSFGPLFYPGDDPEKDLKEISDHFRGIPGKYPEKSFY